ncbi:cathepsin F-like [Anneissia japonica]|uniref:cathepsin F-like n=1 Tax=Anneissia japonica TaxID=1529436 RepID=UPI0014254B0E|nr:cathepsin F-like [Anneissia japonica]
MWNSWIRKSMALQVKALQGEVEDFEGRARRNNLRFTGFPEGSEQDFENFKSFIVKYNRTYEIGSSEYNKRFSIFKESVERQKKLNSKRQHPDDAKYGVNAFSDLTPDEFAEHYLGIYQRVPASTSSGYVPSSKEVDKIPSKFSLEGKGVLTSVRDQGACGGC